MIPDRIDRIAEAIKTELGEIIQRRIKDRRVGFVTVTRVKVSRDLRYCRVFVSIMGSEQDKERSLKGLHSAAGYIRKLLGERIKIRYTPEVSFILDRSLDHSFRIEGILQKIKSEREEKDGAGEDSASAEGS